MHGGMDYHCSNDGHHTHSNNAIYSQMWALNTPAVVGSWLDRISYGTDKSRNAHLTVN